MRDSPEYREFWASLNRGDIQSAEYKRIGKGGKEVWIHASLQSDPRRSGKPFKVVKYATDVTAQKLQNADFAGQIEAIGKSQAVIEFNMDGTILTANENFLGALGYSLAEIQGRHHRMFVDPPPRRRRIASSGQPQPRRVSGRPNTSVGKGGKEIWIQASYNPILDLNGKPFKVVKYATDITAQVVARKKSERVRTMTEGVAAGAEQLNSSVREISAAMTKSKQTASAAVGQVEVADRQAQRLCARRDR